MCLCFFRGTKCEGENGSATHSSRTSTLFRFPKRILTVRDKTPTLDPTASTEWSTTLSEAHVCLYYLQRHRVRRICFTYKNGYCRSLLATNAPLTEEVVGHKLKHSWPGAIILQSPPWLDPPAPFVCRLRVSDTRDPFLQLNVNLTFKYFPCFIYLFPHSTPEWPNFLGQGIPRGGQGISYRQNALYVPVLSTFLIDNHIITITKVTQCPGRFWA